MDSDVIHRVPIITLFAGMKGDTFKMRQAGWILNVHQERDFHRDALRVCITGRHDSYNLRMQSGIMLIDRVPHWGNAGNNLRFMEMLTTAPFEIRIDYIAQNLIIHANSEVVTLARDWSGLMEIKNPKSPKSFDDFYGFPSKEGTIILPESKIWTVQEHLDALRSIQQPAQDEILHRALSERKESKQILKLVAI